MYKIKEYNFEKDKIELFRCEKTKEIEEVVDQIFENNKKILPKEKNAKILVKPNFNNDLNALTGNSTDLRVIISVLRALKKRKYNNIILADGPNCGVHHVGINVFARLCLDKVAKMFDVKLMNFNFDKGVFVELTTGKAEMARTALNADFIIDLPKLKTHVEAGITIACKNYMGCFKGTEKRKMHDALPENIVRLNEIIKTDLIIVDGLIGMEGRGPGDGIPKKVGVIVSGHNPFILDLACSKMMGINYNAILFLKVAIKKGHITQQDIHYLDKINVVAKFKPGTKSLLDRILLNNFFIGIRFSKVFEKLFNKGPLPWILFKMGVKQDKYIFEDRQIKSLSAKDDNKLKSCLETYCPLGMSRIDNKKCLKCMYCYQIAPDLVEVNGELNAFQMQLDRFGKYLRKW